MYGFPNSYSDWARHFEQQRVRRERIKRRLGLACAAFMILTGITLLTVVSCAPAVPVVM